MNFKNQITPKTKGNQAFISIDSNEKRPFQVWGSGIPCIRKRLPVADYSCGNVLIERKALEDFVDCISDRRKQGSRLTQWEKLKAEVQTHHDALDGNVLFLLVEATRSAVLASPKCPPVTTAKDRIAWLESYSDAVLFCSDRTDAEITAIHILGSGATA